MEADQTTEKCEKLVTNMKTTGPHSVSPNADEGVSVDTETTDRTDGIDDSTDDADGDGEFDFSDSDLEDLDNDAENSTVDSSRPVDSEGSSPSKPVLTFNNNNESGLADKNLVIEAINQPAVTTMADNASVYETVNSTLADQFSPNTKKSLENIADAFFDKAQHPPSASVHHSRRRSSAFGDVNHHDEDSSEEDDGIISDFLGKSNDLAEARLAARRQARAEAREIRMRELERQQKEQEQNADRVFDMQQASGIDPIARSRLGVTGSVRGNSLSSRRSSEDSLEEEGRSLRDLRHELKDVEERFRKAMIANAQLDNDRASQSYQIQLLKDKLEEMEESHTQLQREYRDKCRDHDALKRNNDKLKEELKLVQGQLNERDTLIAEQGLVIVMIENDDGTDAKRALVTVENAHLLGSTQGSLDVRLKRFTEEKQELQSEVQKLSQQLADVKSKGKRSNSTNGPIDDEEFEDAQREANKMIADYKYKLQKAEQEIASLQASLARSESQVIRYKSTADASEKAEADLKIERRKLQRENREALERLEELETSNNHLLKRLDKLKNAKSALLKDL